MLKKYLSFTLALLIALQSMAAIADNYQIHQIDKHHIEFQITPQNQSTDSLNQADCHCCHCPFFLSVSISYIPFYSKNKIWSEIKPVYFSTTLIPHSRPPIL